MKRVIDGKVYNTKTAECIGDWDNGCYGNDLDACEESLYKTKKGQFFVAGSGGPRSKYSQSSGSNSWSGGEGMALLSEAEALAWCEDHDIDADVIAECFNIQEG
jgi:hypothetical protein